MNGNHQLSYGVAFICTWLIIIYLFSSTIVIILPDNPASFIGSEVIYRLFPQGWSFFSKSPRDETISIYNLELTKSPVIWPNNHPKNFFGIKRLGRSQGVELGVLYSQINSNAWYYCDGLSQNCLSKLDFVPVVNNSPNPTLCGKYVIVLREPIPWAWSKSVSLEGIPSKIVKVDSSCLRN